MGQNTADKAGRIILLNGPSSAGKSSIAHELQQLHLPEPLLKFGLDEFSHFLPQAFFAIEPEAGHPAHRGLKWVLPLEEGERTLVRADLNQGDNHHLAKYEKLQKALEQRGLSGRVEARGVQIACGPALDQTVFAMHRTAAQLARAGNDVVLDHAFLAPDWQRDFSQALAGLPVFKVGVQAPLAVVKKRERERGYRVIGQARGHYDLVHSGMDYDLVLNTAEQSPQECAATIMAAMPPLAES